MTTDKLYTRKGGALFPLVNLDETAYPKTLAY